jgi:hypothetical protein
MSSARQTGEWLEPTGCDGSPITLLRTPQCCNHKLDCEREAERVVGFAEDSLGPFSRDEGSGHLSRFVVSGC